MFTSVIGTLTSLLPKYFIFGSYVPVVIFSFINLALTYLLSAWARHAIDSGFKTSAPLALGVAFIGTVVIAYVVSSINDFLREFLEGRHIWPPWFAKMLCAEQRGRRDAYARAYAIVRRQKVLIDSAFGGWQEQLRKAASAGAQPSHALAPPGDPLKYAALRALEGAYTAYRRAEPGPTVSGATDDDAHRSDALFDAIQDAVDKMVAALEHNNVDTDDVLSRARDDLLDLLDRFSSTVKETEYATATVMRTYFGSGPVRATRMGNVEGALQSYALDRYGMDLTLFLSRLQTVLTKADDKGYPVVLDAKTQLDFLVACCWFSALTTLLWLAGLAAEGSSWQVYAAVALVGPGATIAFYLLAVQNYLAYAEVLRACVEVNRFRLLRELHIALPDSARQENELWHTLSKSALMPMGDLELSYEHDDAK